MVDFANITTISKILFVKLRLENFKGTLDCKISVIFDKLCNFRNPHAGLCHQRVLTGLWVCGCADQSWPPPTSSPALSACPLSKINKNILFTFKKENKRLNTVEWEKSLLKKALLASAASAEDKQTRPSWIWDIVWARGKVAQVKLRVGLSEQLLYSCVGKAISSWGVGRLWW